MAKVSASSYLGSAGHLLLAVMVAHAGLDPQKHIDWIASPTGRFIELFAAGDVDAFLGFPPRATGAACPQGWSGDLEPKCQPLILLLQLRAGQQTSAGGERDGKV